MAIALLKYINLGIELAVAVKRHLTFRQMSNSVEIHTLNFLRFVHSKSETSLF